MYALKLIGLKKMFGSRVVFENVTVGLENGAKIGLIGPNGIGKTTLLQIISGAQSADAGTVQWAPDWKPSQVGLLTQTTQFAPGETVRELVRRAKSDLVETELLLRQLEAELAEMSNATAHEAELMESLMQRYSQTLEQYEALGGYTFDFEVERVLKEVGLPHAVWETELLYASGGQKTRAQLARLLLQQPQLLLLDEPTNHLDAETMEWLAQAIHAFPGTVLTVSHDRYFLDQIATGILELRADGIAEYAGNYSDYAKAKEAERRTQLAAFEKQQMEMKHLEETIRQFKGWFDQAHQAARQNDFARSKSKKHVTRMRNKERQLERLQENKIERPQDQQTIQVRYDTKDKLSNRLFEVEKVAVSFGERELFREVSFFLERNKRVALIGPNGIGKSTLLKVLTGELEPSTGLVRTNPNVRIGYFGQELDRLDPEKTILQEVMQVDGLSQTDARTLLACFLFPREEVFKPIGQLSQGEKCRVAFVKLYFSGANVLVLDEPTNYLDLQAREKIEQALLRFPGTLLLVSHDRYMVQRLATELLLFEAGRVTHFPGTMQEWQEREQKRSLSPDRLQTAEKRMLLQMEAARLVEQLHERQIKEAEREMLLTQLTAVNEQIRELSVATDHQ